MYTPGQMPPDAPLWMVRELRNIAEALRSASDRLRMEILHVAPDKPRDGDLVFADGTNWNPGSGRGLYERRSGSWVKL